MIKANPVKTIDGLIMSDPGHEWFICHSSDLELIGATEKDFTKFSYKSNDGVYALECDCDFPRLLDIAEKAGVHVGYKELAPVEGSHPIRSWPHLEGGE